LNAGIKYTLFILHDIIDIAKLSLMMLPVNASHFSTVLCPALYTKENLNF